MGKRKIFSPKPSEKPVNYDRLIDAVIKRFPIVHSILRK